MNLKRQNAVFAVGVIGMFGMIAGCGPTKKLSNIQTKQMNARIELPSEKVSSLKEFEIPSTVENDTIMVNFDGREMILMNAIRDEETGEMVATEQLNAAVITARFRNVAERHGKIDLEFQVIVPKEMQDSRWQLRFYPDMYILEDSIRLDQIIITGTDYRKAQLKGYQQYERFLSRIISDTTKFIDLRNLEIFLQRNLPQIYAFKNDSSEVSDTQFESYFGITERDAIEHYTDHNAIRRNKRRMSKREKMFRKYVKAPIVTDHIRLDTVITNLDGDFVYNYVQTINTRPRLRKVDIVLSGDIYEQDKRLYTIPKSDPLTFYISSVSAFADHTERYMTKVIERKAEANAAWYVDFKVGKSDIDESFGNNAENISFIKGQLLSILENETFDVDSIMIVASASPEGSEATNNALSARRAASAANYFRRYMNHAQDSIRREAGMSITVGDDLSEGSMQSASEVNASTIKFKSRSGGENWDYLDRLVENDGTMSEDDRSDYRGLMSISNRDVRERTMAKRSYYRHLKNDMYPRLRTVLFSFSMHRKGMIKDTIHTTILDTTYMKGVKAIVEHDYEAAIALLGPYQDYNTAIAYVALDRNASALGILNGLDKTAPVNYMLALLYSREGDDKRAVESYLMACKQDPGYVHRGNLDPEIAALIKKYNLNARLEEDEFSDLGF